MDKIEFHYLNCMDPNCEGFACVARREYKAKLSIERNIAASREAALDHLKEVLKDALDRVST